MKNSIYVFLFLASLLGSCSSPLDIDVSKLGTLCDHITALGEVYDRVETIIGTTRMKLKSGEEELSEDDLTDEQKDELEALMEKEDEIKYSMTHNSFTWPRSSRAQEKAILSCPRGSEILPWMDK